LVWNVKLGRHTGGLDLDELQGINTAPYPDPFPNREGDTPSILEPSVLDLPPPLNLKPGSTPVRIPVSKYMSEESGVNNSPRHCRMYAYF